MRKVTVRKLVRWWVKSYSQQTHRGTAQQGSGSSASRALPIRLIAPSASGNARVWYENWELNQTNCGEGVHRDRQSAGTRALGEKFDGVAQNEHQNEPGDQDECYRRHHRGSPSSLKTTVTVSNPVAGADVEHRIGWNSWCEEMMSARVRRCSCSSKPVRAAGR